MRGQRPAEFERRSALYARLDRQLCHRTRFFAAAALVNAVLSKRFEILPAVRSPRSLCFLNEVGAALETDNLAYAREINGPAAGVGLDHILVCAEQARLQRHVHAHQAQRPHQWEFIRREINGLLNGWHAASLLSRWCKEAERVTRVLREVREHLGMELNFAMESHRIRIGLRLIEHIRGEEPCPQPGNFADPQRGTR